MGNDTVISFSDPALRDELSELVRQGAEPVNKFETLAANIY